jgi:DNA polymerase III subunit delta'
MWHGTLGHDEVVEQFRRTLKAGRLASTYLFVGPAGVGKRRFALELAHALLCTQTPDAALEACGRCQSCRLFAAGNHPDLDVVGLPKDKSKLPIELFIGDREHRHQEGLCHRIALKPFLSGRRVAIIDDADYFNQESANCLLKTLEEPPPHSLLILIGTSPSRQLPTIRSRAQIVRFAPLDSDDVVRILAETGLVADPKQAAKAAERSEGSVARAIELANPDLESFREQLLAQLANPSPVRMARVVQAFVDDAGKEATQKRDRLRIVIGFAIAYYRELLRGDGAAAGLERAVGALDGCLSALEHVDRNANLAMAIQQWSDELAHPSPSSSNLSLV